MVAGRIHLEATLRLEGRQRLSAYEPVSPANDSERSQIHHSVYKRDGGNYARSMNLPAGVIREE